MLEEPKELLKPSLVLALTLSVMICAAGQTAKKPIKQTSICELLKNPTAYDNQTIQLQAVFVRGGEENSELFCPKCLIPYGIYADFDDFFSDLTPPKVLRAFEKRTHVMLSVTLIGKFITKRGGHMGAYKHQFIILRSVRAVELPYPGRAPRSLSKTELKGIRRFCQL